MAKFYGKIGFDLGSIETPAESGVWVEQVEEKPYYGDLVRRRTKLDAGSDINDDINISQDLVIVMDEYCLNHLHVMRYVNMMGARWKITNVEIEHPHLRLSIGGVYNGPTPTGTTQ